MPSFPSRAGTHTPPPPQPLWSPQPHGGGSPFLAAPPAAVFHGAAPVAFDAFGQPFSPLAYPPQQSFAFPVGAAAAGPAPVFQQLPPRSGPPQMRPQFPVSPQQQQLMAQQQHQQQPMRMPPRSAPSPVAGGGALLLSPSAAATAPEATAPAAAAPLSNDDIARSLKQMLAIR
jgi:hypothetical protein